VEFRYLMPYNPLAATYMRFTRGLQFVSGLQDLIACLPADLTMVEIGVFAGESTRIFLGSGKVSKLFAVDPWASDYEQDDGVWHSPVDWDDVYDTFQVYQRERNVEVPGSLLALRTTSLDAALLFKRAELDFVYIDGNHSYRAVKADIEAWRPKIRDGGYIGGHDLSPAFPSVAQALLDTRIGFGRTFQDTSWLVRL
jgi:hypothetical protein